MHVARVSQCFKFLADTRDPTVRQVALLQLDEVVRKRMRVPRYTPISIEDLSSFLNTLAASKEGARGDIKSLWSSARASLSHTHSAIHISSDSAVVHCEGKEVRWAKRHEVNQILKQATQSRHLASLQDATDQGRATYSTSLSDTSNFFIYLGAFLSFPQYRFTLKARLNLLPTRTVQVRSGTILQDTRCRICHQHPETLAHLLNHCHQNLGLVRERHNAVLERLIRAIPPSVGSKFKEQSVPNTSGANRPDLTIISPNGHSVILVDISIPFEGCPQALEEAAKAKTIKYEPLRQELLLRYDQVEVYPFLIGSLGSLFLGNDLVLHRLHIGRNYAYLMKKLCVASVIAGSQNIWYHSACSRVRSNVPARETQGASTINPPPPPVNFTYC